MTIQAGSPLLVRGATSSWEVLERTGSPRDLHGERGSPGRRQMVLTWPTSGAVVLGSTQPFSDFDADRCAQAGLDLVRRRSGGGAVLVQPGAQLWVDFYVPVTDRLLTRDVSRSFLWLGELWAAALEQVHELLQPEIFTAARRHGAWEDRLCFCGVARGEVTIGGRKAVGLCQRRDRDGAWFHTMVLTHLDVALTSSLLACGPKDRRRAARALECSATALPAEVPTARVVEALVRELGRLAEAPR